MKRTIAASVLGTLVVSWGCAPGAAEGEGSGVDGSGRWEDGGLSDAGARNGGIDGGGSWEDGGLPDAGTLDSGTDGGASSEDGGLPDAGARDGGTHGGPDGGRLSDAGEDAGASGLPGTFFGMTQTLLGGAHDITITVGVLRLWDTPCTWNFTETALDTYDFTSCDAWFDYAVAIGASPIFVMGRTPSWAIEGGAASCTGIYAPHGCAQLPSDIAGANTLLPNFITALASHVKARHPTLRWGIEGLNEADLGGECAGAVSGHCAMADLVAYQRGIFTNAHAVDPNIEVLGPAASTFNSSGPHLYNPQTGSATCPGTGCPGAGFLLAGGGAFMDAASFHPYLFCGGSNFCQTPEAGGIVAGLAAIHSTLNKFGLSNLPIVYTESDWGAANTNDVLTDDQKTEYFARQLVYLWDDGAAGHWWYSWECASGDLARCFGTWFESGRALPVVAAYSTSRQWLLGSDHLVRSCNHDVDGHGTWSCDLTTAAGVPSRILMNANGNQIVSVPGFTTQHNLDGTSSGIASHQVTASLKPILIQ